MSCKTVNEEFGRERVFFLAAIAGEIRAIAHALRAHHACVHMIHAVRQERKEKSRDVDALDPVCGRHRCDIVRRAHMSRAERTGKESDVHRDLLSPDAINIPHSSLPNITVILQRQKGKKTPSGVKMT